ncbi:hypothetical protein BC830DRAFT_1090794 [Chytriomyces sp. MP71]|nr:hypothetical protein BC830DRAFT_1090794 [Chytriomyces sp. MP71]
MLRGKGATAVGGRFDAGAAPNAAVSQTVTKLVQQSRSSGRLNLSNQSLRTLPNALFTREDLKGGEPWWEETDLLRLTVADNELDAIDERVVQFGALTAIDAHNNCISVLPDLSALQSLTILQLSGNKLSVLPESLFSLPLAELHVSNNCIVQLPSEFERLGSTLVIMDISNNALAALPTSSFSQFSQLTKFSAKSNKLAGPLCIRVAAPSLTHLDVSHNKLTSLGDLTGCNKLQDLNVSQNALNALFTGIVVKLPSLVVLDIRINRLTSLGPDNSVCTPLLKDLLVAGNLLTTIAGSGLVESCLAGLETLDVRDNNLDAVPALCVDMTELKRLLLEGNAIRVPRRAILEKGTNAVLQWMRDQRVPV